MEFRNMVKTLFGNKTPPQDVTYYKLLNDYVPTFTPYDGEIYDSDIGRTCIDAIAKNAAKLKPKHIRRINDQIVKTGSDLERLLQVRPNEYMNTYDFLYKVVSQLYSHNNSFIYIKFERGGVTGLYPINFSSLELVDYQGELYCRFIFKSGYRMTVPYADLIHLRRHFNHDDIFGEDSRKPLKTTLNLITTINQGITNSIKYSARIRGLLKFTGTIRPEDLKNQRDQFVKDYLGIDNEGGIGATDSKAEFVPTKVEAKTADEKQMQFVRDNAYRYFGISEKIVQSSYNEDEFNAFYASVIEPIAIQLSLEFTAKLFTSREKGHGNEVVFSASRLMYASNKTKVEMAKELMPAGLFTINEMREIFELEPVADGDKRLQSLNFVDAKKANKYQVGEEDEKNGESNKGNQAV